MVIEEDITVNVKCRSCGRFASMPEDKVVCLDCWEKIKEVLD